MRSLHYLRWILGGTNVQAFLRAVRVGESHPEDPLAYRALFGWRHGETGQVWTGSLATHPRAAFRSKWGWTSAFGAYQAMAAVPGKVTTDTWDNFDSWCRRAGYVPTMEPADQDLFAVWCLERRRALDAVCEGRFEEAVHLCAKEWASLPGSPYGQPTVTMGELANVYRAFGGILAPQADPGAVSVMPEPAPEPAPAPASAGASTEWDLQNPPPLASDSAPDSAPIPSPNDPNQEAPMSLPVIPALIGPLVAELAAQIPRVATLWKGKSEVAERNVALGSAILETVSKAVGAANAQEAVERVRLDPDAARLAREAIDRDWGKLDELREASIASAREFARAAPERIIVWNMVFHELLALVMLVMCFLGMVLAWASGTLDTATKNMIVTVALIGGFIGIKEFWYGGSRGSDIKTSLLTRDKRD